MPDSSTFQMRKGRVWNLTCFQGRKIMKNNKKMLVDEIFKKSYQTRGHLSKDELEKIDKNKWYWTYLRAFHKERGWMGKHKGLPQVLCERWFINLTYLSSYSLKGGKLVRRGWYVKKRIQNYLQCTMMSRCSNSANEKSTMEHLFLQLSRKADPTLLMLTSSKYHCEVTGERIKFIWRILKQRFRSFSLKEKIQNKNLTSLLERTLRVA